MDKLLGDTEYLLEQWGGGEWMGWGSGYVLPVSHEPKPCQCRAQWPTTSLTIWPWPPIGSLLDSSTAAPQAGDFRVALLRREVAGPGIAREHQIGEAKVRETLKLAVGWTDSALERFQRERLKK
ncbi:antitermination protein Q [Pseudomonas aeruginosa]